MPRLFLAGTPTRDPAVVAFKRTSQDCGVDRGPICSRSTGGSGPVSLEAKSMRTSIPTRHDLNQPIPGFVQAMHSTPRRFARPVSAVLAFHAGANLHPRETAFLALRISETSGQTSPAPVAFRPTERSFWNPLGSRPAGTQNTLAPNGRKLGQLRCARQGLVRVPESNTKYGGKRGITGGHAEPVIRPSISES